MNVTGNYSCTTNKNTRGTWRKRERTENFTSSDQKEETTGYITFFGPSEPSSTFLSKVWRSTMIQKAIGWDCSVSGAHFLQCWLTQPDIGSELTTTSSNLGRHRGQQGCSHSLPQPQRSALIISGKGRLLTDQRLSCRPESLVPVI